MPRYLERSFDLWYGKLMEVFDALCFLYRTFLVRELESYLSKSEEETLRARELAESRLSQMMPDFAQLIQEATAGH